MDSKIKTVAVIGAGVSGIASAVHLKAAGLNVTVYERSASAGGVWIYDDRKPLDPTWPALIPSVADFEPIPKESCANGGDIENGIALEDEEKVELLHAPPGPAYEGLRNNISTHEMELKNQSWPPGTEEFTSHRVIKLYLQDIADRSGADEFLYNTKVEFLWKEEGRWRVRSKTLTRLAGGELRTTKEIRRFDAVVVASGHYHAPRVPDISGLADWKRRWPDRVHHAKGYRSPDRYRNQSVLLIGGGTTSGDISRELSTITVKTYQSSRGGAWDFPAGMLPPNAIRIEAIESFDAFPQRNGYHTSHTASLDDSQTIPGTVVLKSGITLRDIHNVILCTGYQFTLPFLPYLHSDTLPPEKATPEILVTAEGIQFHNLHLDIFYIPDPTLAIVGAPFGGATFTLFEFQAIAVSRVFSGRADLPSEPEMRTVYEEKRARKGYGRKFHSVMGEEIDYVNQLVEWVNRDGARFGAPEVDAHSEKWMKSYGRRVEKMKKIIEMKKLEMQGKPEVEKNMGIGWSIEKGE
ncbi:MAG: hypothetical protein MMC33_008550 [Icmadophila ericetorum]|nr:hypothetical protein [Icmadophila ericetorum]